MLGQDLPTLPTAKSKDQQYAFVWRLQRLLAFPSLRPTDRRRRRRRSKFAFRRGAVPPTSFRPPARTTASPLLFLIRLAAAASVSPAPTACAKTIRERGRTERGATKCNEVSRSQNGERWTTGDGGCPLLGRKHRCWLGFFRAPHSLLFHTQGN